MNVFDKVRENCSHAAEVAKYVRLEPKGIENWAKELDLQSIRQRVAGLDGSENAKLMVQFETTADNVNYRALYGLMQMGHGFRYELHRTLGGGASKTITKGFTSLCNNGGLTAKRLAVLTTKDIQYHFGIDDKIIKKEPALATLVDQIHQGLQGTGSILQNAGYHDMNEWILKILTEARRDDKPPAASLVLAFKETFPFMNDIGTIQDGSEVWLLKKAILSTYLIHHSVGTTTTDERYCMGDIDTATGIVDNVVPAMLLKYGAISIVNDALKEQIQNRKLLQAGPQEAELRAVAVIALERLAAELKKGGGGGMINATILSHYLWLIGKDGDNRTFERHHTQDTIYY